MISISGIWYNLYYLNWQAAQFIYRIFFWKQIISIQDQPKDIYSGHSPPPWGVGKILSKLKNREEFEGGLEKIPL